MQSRETLLSAPRILGVSSEGPSNQSLGVSEHPQSHLPLFTVQLVEYSTIFQTLTCDQH